MQNNILKLAICPHCINEEELYLWGKIAENLSKTLNRKIDLITFSDFMKEEESLRKENCHIYYANPNTAIYLMQKGYEIIGKLKDENNQLCSISRKDYSSDKDIIKLAVIKRKYFFLPILFHKKEFRKFQLVFANSYEEIIELLQKKEADVGFIYTKMLRRLEDEYNIKFDENFCFNLPHYIVIHPSISSFKEDILSLPEIERVTQKEVENLKLMFAQLEKMLEEWANSNITEALLHSPNLGIIIYQERIVYANDYALRFLGYEKEELYNMSSFDLVYGEEKSKIIENYHRRLRGEKFSSVYEIKFIKKDGSISWVQCLTNTILYQGRYSGLILFHDITERKQNEEILKILRDVNKIITQSITEEEIYEGICRSLVENLGFKFVWIGIPEKGKIVPIYHYGEEQGFFDVLDIKIEEGYGLSQIAFKTGEIQINEDSREYLKKEPCAVELINRNFMSSCTIPKKKYGKVVSLLKIYSQFPKFFNKNIVNILEEIQNDLSFALERVDRIKHDMIISEALKHSDTWVLVTDENGHILYVNEAVEKISGYTRDELIGKNPRIFKSGLNPPEFYKQMWDTILSGEIFNAITPNRKKNGEIFHADLKIIPLKLPGNVLRFVAVARDVTENIMLSERINKLQNHDTLTELLNLNGFSVEVTLKLRETHTKGALGVFILIDIVNMTYMNKILGFSGGDLVLRLFAQRLKELFKETYTIARIGADTFGIYLSVDMAHEISNVYSKLVELNNTKIQIYNETISININAAISLFPKDGETFKTLYEKADIALTKAKAEGEGAIKFFDPEIEKDVEKQWDVISLVKKAFDENLFVFYYQPYFYTDSLKLAGYEALVRIVDKSGEVYYPKVFIDYIENSSYLRMFEDWAINEIVQKIKKWNLNISVNISGKTFNNPEFVEKLAQIPEEIRDKITIEITERVFIENPEDAMVLISMIKKIKNPPKIAMDDFGTGYSSFVYLKDLPVDIIKIDMAFTKQMVFDKKALAIVQTIIELAKRLDKLTLAEGVETKEQLEILKSLKCDLVQGFLFSKPLPEKEVESGIIN